MSDFFKKVSYNMKEKGWCTSLMAVMLMAILSLYAMGFGPNSSFFSMVYAAKSSDSGGNNQPIMLGGGNNGDTSKNKDNKNADTASEVPTSDQQQQQVEEQPPIPTPTPESTQLIASTLNTNPTMASIPEGKNCATNLSERPNPIQYLTYFNCGHVSTLKNGTTLRQYSLIVSENNTIPISDLNTNDPVLFDAWRLMVQFQVPQCG